MKIKYKYMLGLLALSLASSLASENTPAVTNLSNQSLSLNSALIAAQASIDKCQSQGIGVSVSVVDNNGLLRVLLKSDSASPISTTLSQRKAFTAANFKKDTTLLVDLSDTAVGRSEGILMSAGGVLITVDETTYGAIGVSGADSGAKDDECAKAGVDAIIEMYKASEPTQVQETEQAS